MVYSRKKPNRGGARGEGGGQDMEFRGLLKKENVEFQGGSIKNEVEFPGVFTKKFMWNFHGSWFLTL